MREAWRRGMLGASVALTTLYLCSSPALAQGCAMCRTAIDGQDDPLSRGISKSVIFMICMPFAVFFSAAGYLYVFNRKANAARRTEASAPAAAPAALGATQSSSGGF